MKQPLLLLIASVAVIVGATVAVVQFDLGQPATPEATPPMGMARAAEKTPTPTPPTRRQIFILTCKDGLPPAAAVSAILGEEIRDSIASMYSPNPLDCVAALDGDTGSVITLRRGQIAEEETLRFDRDVKNPPGHGFLRVEPVADLGDSATLAVGRTITPEMKRADEDAALRATEALVEKNPKPTLQEIVDASSPHYTPQSHLLMIKSGPLYYQYAFTVTSVSEEELTKLVAEVRNVLNPQGA